MTVLSAYKAIDRTRPKKLSQPISPTDAWSKSKGYGGAIFWAGFLAAMLGILLCIPLLAPIFFLQLQSSSPVELALVLLNCATQLVFEALAVGALSFARQSTRVRVPANKGLQLTPASWAFLSLVVFWRSTT